MTYIKHQYKAIVCSILLGCSCFTQTGCFGSFKLTQKVYTYNESIGNRYLSTGIMYLFTYCLIYPIALLIDTAIYNVIEFWTGENPLTMGPLEQQTKMVAVNGSYFQVTVSQNHFHIQNVSKGSVTDLVYQPQTHSWQVLQNGMLLAQE